MGKAAKVKKPEGATHLEDERPPDDAIGPQESFEGMAGAFSSRAVARNLEDPTDEILLSGNRTPGMPDGGWQGVTIHTEEGYHDPSVAWLRNPVSSASAHFCVKRDGHITQLVWEHDRAWHAKGSGMYYFGIEHEGSSYPDESRVPCFWTTPANAARLNEDDAMLKSSARLVAYLCAKYDLRVQHDFTLPARRDTESVVAGHDQMFGNDHRDPGPRFPWKAYMAEVGELLGGTGPDDGADKPRDPEAEDGSVEGPTGAVAIIDRHLRGNGRVIAEEARRAGLELALACALVDHESMGGQNIFGCDHGNVGDRPPYCRQPVTKERVARLRDSGMMNGVGLTQLTWHSFVTQAEEMGGAHLPRNQCRVGFSLLKRYVDSYPYREALGAYNAGEERRRLGVTNGYASKVEERHRVWKERLGGSVGEKSEVDALRPNLVAVGQRDEEAMHAAAQVFRRRGMFVTSTAGEQEVRDLDEVFSEEPIGTRQMIVVGGPALGALLPDSVQHVHNPYRPGVSDYVGAVGEDYEATLKLLEGLMQAHAGNGAGPEFRSVLGAGRGERPEDGPRPPKKDDERDEKPRAKERGPDQIIGAPIFPPGRLEALARARGAARPALEMIRPIYQYARRRNIGADLLCCQMFLETGFGKYGGASKAYNPAGIKTKNAKGDAPRDFEVPASADEGARMLVNHWVAVLGLEEGPIGTPHERYWVAKEVYARRPDITKISQLGNGNWATDRGYAAKIQRLLDELDGGKPAPDRPPRDTDRPERPEERPIDLARYTPTNHYGLGPHADRARQHLVEVFRGFPWIEGYRPGDSTEHFTRKAVDLGTSLRNQPDNKAFGDKIADYLIRNRQRLKIVGIIWWERQIGYSEWGYSDWSGWKPQWWKPPANWQGDGWHHRHVHVSFGE